MVSFSQRLVRMVHDMKYEYFSPYRGRSKISWSNYEVMAGMALWGKIEQICPKGAYKGAIYILVARYDKFWPYLCLHYQFWPFSILSGMFDHIAIKMPSIYVHIWRSAAHSGQFWRIESELATYIFQR